MEIRLPEGAPARTPFAGGLLTVLLVPTEHTLDECAAVLAAAGVRTWTEPLPAPADETVLVAGVPYDEAPSMDAIGDARRHVLALLDAAGVDVDVRGSGYLTAEALERWGAHSPA